MSLDADAPAVSAGAAYREALEHVYSSHRAFEGFLKARAEIHYSHARAYEVKTGRLAHKDRAAASEAQYILQQFERLTP